MQTFKKPVSIVSPNKPLIQLTIVASYFGSRKSVKKWQCHDNLFIIGNGDTPSEAYHDWKRKESLRTRIPRKGQWNLKSVKDWYNRGCPLIRSYIGSQQIYSYDIKTDELVLRG